MRKYLITSVSAAAIIAAASIAVAQDKGPGAGGGAGAGASAPSARDFGGAGGGQSGGGGDRADRGGSSMPSAEKMEPKAESSGRNAEASGDKQSSEKRPAERAAKDGAKDLKGGAAKDDLAKKGSPDGAKDSDSAASGASSGESGNAAPGNAAGNMKADSKSSADAKQGGPHVTLNSDQRSRVNSAFKGHKGSANVSVNVDIRVGTRLPRSVALVAIPSDVIVVVPDWRRYKYIVVGDTVCIVDPDTFEIIDVIVLA